MPSLVEKIEQIVTESFVENGLDAALGRVSFSKRLDLCQFQCNGAMAAAKQRKQNPRELAQQIADKLSAADCFAKVEVAGPGFINLTLTDAYLTQHVATMAGDERLGCVPVANPAKVIIDYGGANIAKPLHVGHLRSGIIGESLKRLGRFLGHDVLGDVHLGDWGLQMGMVIHEIKRRQPELPYFQPDFSGDYPSESPVSAADLEEIYPKISGEAKADADLMAICRQTTYELQQGNPGYRALWQHIYDVSVADLKRDYGQLNIEFDLWLGESDTRDVIPGLIESLKKDGCAEMSDGALVVSVEREDDKKSMPPLMLVKSDGAVLYGTTDLATILQRVEQYNPDLILYVVDRRQHVHFEQVFRGARKAEMGKAEMELEHVGFGTMNGKDGKPFKTRAGGVMKLKDLIAMVTEKAQERLQEADISAKYGADEMAAIANKVGVATLKYADLMNHPSTDYVFDLDRFSSFDGRTGPYQLYSAVRIKSILDKAKAQGLAAGDLLPPQDETERLLVLKLTELPDALRVGFDKRSPNLLCEYIYTLGSAFNTFYHDHHILRESDSARQASWLRLATVTLATMELVLGLLGIEVPDRM